MKIYLAAKFENREAIRPYRDRLWKAGHQVVSTWLDEVKRPEGMSHHCFMRKLAAKDLQEISSCDLLILDSTPNVDGKAIQGANVEYGFALGRHQNQQIWLVGMPTCVFHYVADEFFSNWETATEMLEHWGEWRPYNDAGV